MEIGKQIRKYRTELKLSQDDLEQMKDEIKTEDIRSFRRDSRIYGIFLEGVIVLKLFSLTGFQRDRIMDRNHLTLL